MKNSLEITGHDFRAKNHQSFMWRNSIVAPTGSTLFNGNMPMFNCAVVNEIDEFRLSDLVAIPIVDLNSLLVGG